MLAPLLDRFLYRQPFEGGSARRYALAERPAFGDLDDRLLDQMELAGAKRLLDLGCGPATFSERAATRHPHLAVIAVDPSRAFAREVVARQRRSAIAERDGLHGTGAHEVARRAAGRFTMVRAFGEALPFPAGSIDVAICLSSIRHVRDRLATLRELRRVVAQRVLIVELDPDADRERIAAHADRIDSPVLRRAFAPLVLKTAPPATVIAQLARQAGFTERSLRPDPIQPVYIMDLA